VLGTVSVGDIMGIPINYLVRYGRRVGITEFNGRSYTETQYRDVGELPCLDIMTMELNSNGYVIVGRDKRHLVVSNGGNILIRVDKEFLVDKRIYNNCELRDSVDIGDRFPNKDIKFRNWSVSTGTVSAGIAKKIVGEYKGKKCIVKFPKRDKLEAEYEELYYIIGKIANVRVCKSVNTVYDSKTCSVSIFGYGDNDNWVTIRTLMENGKSFGDILDNLDENEREQFNRQMVLDYIMGQQDRHMSNLAICNGKVYGLYDNGECLGLGTIGQMSENLKRYTENLGETKIREVINSMNISAILEEVKGLGKDEYVLGRLTELTQKASRWK
jgi:hypothetical protein